MTVLTDTCLPSCFIAVLSSASLTSKPLQLREDTHEWTTMMAESLSATPVVLNDGAFDGNFGDLVNWVAY